MVNIPTMLERAFTIQNQLTQWRRDFHMYPEIGFGVHRTASIVSKTLTSLDCRVKCGIGKTGVIGELGQGSPVFAIRADMDALPILEANTVPYISKNPGVMHACGHDAHTSMLLGVATLLSGENLPGIVRLLFQPAEEVSDEENLSGAPRMIQDGAMDAVDAVLALHVDVHFPVGTIRISSGLSSGRVDNFYGQIIGKGGHGARPHETIDPFFLTAQVINSLNGIVSRRLNPFDPAVVSIGTIHGGQAPNVIPDMVQISGTIRYIEVGTQQQIHTELVKAFSIARNYGGNYQLKIEIGDKPLVNDPRMVALVQSATGDLLGLDHVGERVNGLGAEDFGCFLELAPGAMFRLGCQIEGSDRLHHSPNFDLDERCLPYGSAVMAETALRFLKNGGFQ